MPFRTELLLNAGDTRKCLSITINSDQDTEFDESFMVFAQELGLTTQVVILDDDGKNT